MNRTDANQSEIVAALRKIGCTVHCLHEVGKGCPDLLVGYRNKNFLLEIKKDKASKLTPAQVKWHSTWRGSVEIIPSVQDALDVVTR